MKEKKKKDFLTEEVRVATEQQRIAFIKSIEGYEKINPYLDLSMIKKIKELLHKNGLYQVDLVEIRDSSIVNLLTKAQGKKPFRISKAKNSTKMKRKVFYD